MPSQEFPMAQYLQAYQNKYANEQAAKPDLGVALAGGITQGSNMGVNMWAQEKAKRQESTFNAAKDYFSKGEFYIKGTKDPLPPEQVSQFYEMLYDKKLKMKGNKDGTASFSTDKDVPFNIDWKPRDTISVFGGLGSEVNIPEGFEIAGYDAKGKPIIKKKEDTGAKLSKIEAEAAARAKGAESVTGSKELKDLNTASSLRKEFNDLPEIKSFTGMKRSYEIMGSALKEAQSKGDTQSKAAADQALVITFNKMLDPTSVVRESEYARTPEGQSAIAQLQGYVEKVRQGGVGLTNENRQSVIDISKKLMASAQKVYKERRSEYSDLATKYKTAPDMVVGKDYSISGLEEQQIPTYASEADVLKNPPAIGTKILIGGREAIWQ